MLKQYSVVFGAQQPIQLVDQINIGALNGLELYQIFKTPELTNRLWTAFLVQPTWASLRGPMKQYGVVAGDTPEHLADRINQMELSRFDVFQIFKTPEIPGYEWTAFLVRVLGGGGGGLEL